MKKSTTGILLGIVLSTTATQISAQMINSMFAQQAPRVAFGSYELRHCGYDHNEMDMYVETAGVTIRTDSRDQGYPGILFIGRAQHNINILNYANTIEGSFDPLAARPAPVHTPHSRGDDSHSWVPFTAGGMPEPTELFFNMPASRTFELHRTQCGTLDNIERMCDIFGSKDRDGYVTGGQFDFGGAYGIVDSESQARIEQMLSFDGVEQNREHLMLSFAFRDGAQNEKYNAALSFDCSESYVPKGWRNRYDSRWDD